MGISAPMSFTYPLSFRHHALSVLVAAVIGSAIVTSGWTVALLIALHGRPVDPANIGLMSIAAWFGIGLIALPSAGLILSLLWPVTRRATIASGIVCVLAGMAAGLIVSPMW